MLVQLMTADIRSARRGGVLSPAGLAEHLVARGWRPSAAQELAAAADDLARTSGLTFDQAADTVATVIEGFGLIPPEPEGAPRHAARNCTSMDAHTPHDWRHWRSAGSFVWHSCDGTPRCWPSAEEILAQPCTECGATPGAGCRGIDVDGGEFSHATRMTQAENAKKEAHRG